jgi:hypothetical protein
MWMDLIEAMLQKQRDLVSGQQMGQVMGQHMQMQMQGIGGIGDNGRGGSVAFNRTFSDAEMTEAGSLTSNIDIVLVGSDR